MSFHVDRDPEVARHLRELRRFETIRGKDPEVDVVSVWFDLRRSWWYAATLAYNAERSDSAFPNWPGWIRGKLSDEFLDLCLRTVYAADWTRLTDGQVTKDDPIPRFRNLSHRLGQGRSAIPWKLFLYISVDALSSVRLMKEFSSCVGPFSAVRSRVVIALLNQKAVGRVWGNPTVPVIERVDMRAAMKGMFVGHGFSLHGRFG